MFSGQHAERQGSKVIRSVLSIVFMVLIVFGLSRLLNMFVFGDIVTFADPLVSNRTLIKRVIATGGQTVDLQNGKVVVDGVVLDEPYIENKVSEPFEKTAVPISYPYTVPEGCLWVMGDNRTNSQDSRYFGAIDASSVTGHAVFTYWPIPHIGVLS